MTLGWLGLYKTLAVFICTSTYSRSSRNGVNRSVGILNDDLLFPADSVDVCFIDDRKLKTCYQDEGYSGLSDAQATCSSLGARLPYIQSAAKVAMFKKNFDGQIWVSLTTDIKP